MYKLLIKDADGAWQLWGVYGSQLLARRNGKKCKRNGLAKKYRVRPGMTTRARRASISRRRRLAQE